MWLEKANSILLEYLQKTEETVIAVDSACRENGIYDTMPSVILTINDCYEAVLKQQILYNELRTYVDETPEPNPLYVYQYGLKILKLSDLISSALQEL